MMTSDDLIREGRQLQRPCVFLSPEPNGPVAGVWYEDDSEINGNQPDRCWLTIDSGQVPIAVPSLAGFMSIYTDELECQGGRVEIGRRWPDRPGTRLYGHAADVLPPIDAVFARGSDAVGAWIQALGWDRGERYNDNFEGRDIVQEYERVWMAEHPIYSNSDVYAVLGGWHFTWPDDDWHELLDEQFLGFTLREAEPWVEFWRLRTGELKVIQRIT